MNIRLSHFAISFIAVLIYGSRLLAIPAYPFIVEVSTDNGKTVKIHMRGDENCKYAVTLDGYTLLSDSDGWWYASLSEDSIVVKSEFKLTASDDETTALKAFKEKCPRGLKPNYHAKSHVNRVLSTDRAPQAEPIVGERRALVILMQFSNLPFKKTREDFVSLFNDLNYSQNDAVGSVRDYYRFASQGQLDYISDVYGPYTSKQPMNYYGSNSTNGGGDGHAIELCIEAIKNLPTSIDYTIYDNDGDGLIDNVHIIFAGYGEEAGASSDAIWSHEYPHRIALKSEIGYSLAGYSCSPELRGNHGTKISNIGVVCHELGHSLGAMDYYDTNYETGGEYEGTGQWDIMASGSWNDDGRTPPNFNPYVRSTIFGWNSQSILTANQSITMPRMEVDNAEESIIYRLETGSEGDFFLLENRQLHGFDAALPGSGLMIYHVHPNIERYRVTNTINASHPQGFYPVCASSSDPAKKKYGNINSSECPFPGSKKVRVFSPTSSPAAVAWNGKSAVVSIYDITMNSSNGTLSFRTGNGAVVNPDNPDNPTEMRLEYKESFESNIDGRLAVVSSSGKSQWRTYKQGNYIVEADLIPAATDGERILMLLSGKNTSMGESEIVGPEIKVVPGDNYTFSFDICSRATSIQLPKPSFRLYIEDDYGEYEVYRLNETTEQWIKAELPLVFAGNMFRYKFYGNINLGGIFVDNVCLFKEEQLTNVKHLFNTKDNQLLNVYKIDGSFIGSFIDIPNHLQPGLYMVKSAEKTAKMVIPRE